MTNKFSRLILSCLIFSALVLPANAQAPALIVEKAIEIADKAVDDSVLDIKNYYLFSVVLTNSSKGQFWYHTYRAINPSEYNQIFAKVYMDGHVELSGGPFSEG